MENNESIVISRVEYPDSIEFDARGKSKHKVKLYTDLLRPELTRKKIEGVKDAFSCWSEIMINDDN
jgi:hypothetical protein